MSSNRKPEKQESDFAVVLFALALIICFIALLALVATAVLTSGISLPGLQPSPNPGHGSPTPVTTMVPGQGLVTPTPVSATPTPFAATATPVSATPTPFAATATPVSATPTPFPVTPTPVPATSTSVPVTPSPGPVTPTPGPINPLSANIAYVSDSATRTISTLDSDTGTLTPAFYVNFVPGHCILGKDGSKAYISSRNKLMIVNPRSGDVLGSLDFDKDIALMDITRDGSLLVIYTAGNDEGGVVASIDTSTDRIVKSITGVPYSWGMTISHSNVLYLGDYFQCQLAIVLFDSTGGYWGQKINCASPGSYTGLSYWKNNTYWANAGCVGDVAVSPDDRYFYVSRWSSNKFSIVNMSSFQVEREVTMPGRSSAGVAVSPDGQRVYVTNHDMNLVLVYDATGNLVNTIPVKPGPRKIAISGNGHHLIVLYEGNGMSLVDVASGALHNYNIVGPSIWFPGYS